MKNLINSDFTKSKFDCAHLPRRSDVHPGQLLLLPEHLPHPGDQAAGAALQRARPLQVRLANH